MSPEEWARGILSSLFLEPNGTLHRQYPYRSYRNLVRLCQMNRAIACYQGG